MIIVSLGLRVVDGGREEVKDHSSSSVGGGGVRWAGEGPYWETRPSNMLEWGLVVEAGRDGGRGVGRGEGELGAAWLASRVEERRGGPGTSVLVRDEGECGDVWGWYLCWRRNRGQCRRRGRWRR